MRHKLFHRIFISFFILSFLSSCNKGLSSEEGINPQDTEGNIIYPLESEVPTTHTSNDVSTTPYPFEVTVVSPESAKGQEVQPQFYSTQYPPSPKEGVGIVYGTLVSLTNGYTIPQVTLIAADKVDLEGSDGYVISFREKSSPRGHTDENGQFTIDDISPGEYVLMLVTPGGSFLGLDKDHHELHLVIKANSVVNLGEVLISWP